MPHFTVHTIDSAPEGAKEVLRTAQQACGFVPNLLGVMAEAPSTPKAYLEPTNLFQSTSLSDQQQQVVILAASQANDCDYCKAAHSLSAEKAGLPAEEIEALRAGRPLADEPLEALRRFTVQVVQTRGRPQPEEIDAFLAAGFTEAQILEVISSASP